MQERYDHKRIEEKWQKEWAGDKIYQAPDKTKGKDNFYTLVEFPYPSGNLHIGHWYAFAVPDIFARTKRMQGYNVMFPIGFDSFGLPAENAAIKRGLDPKKWTYENIDYMENQLKSMGNSFDWSRKVVTSDPEYYKWTQWLFLKFYEKGLAYKKKANANWCPSCKTVLANEQVVGGKCERCGTEVIQKDLDQWFFKITDYAERLIEDLEDLKWPESIKDAQRNWIGKSEGALIDFPLDNPSPDFVSTLPEGEGAPKYYTTDLKTYRTLQDRAVGMRENPTKAEDALWQGLRRNATGSHFRRQWIIDRFIVDFVCLERKLVIEVDGDIHDLKKEEDEERTKTLEEKGFRVVRFKNEQILNNAKDVLKEIHGVLKALPLGEGLGGVVSVFTTRADTLFGATYLVFAPEHQLISEWREKIENWEEVEKYIEKTKSRTEIERIAEGKEKTGVEIKGIKAINPATDEEIPIWIADYVLLQYGTGAIMAVPSHDERDMQFAKKFNLPIKNFEPDWGMLDKFGKKTVKYKLRDWLLSRQRYWGCPIPIVYDPEGNPKPIPEKHLPWLLPEDVDFTPKGKSPLASSKELEERTEKIFGQGWKSEEDTMDTFVDSSWYFLRYCDPQNKKEFSDKKKLKQWMPVGRYSGGAEHTTMHLLYSRFFHKALFDMKLVNEKEPFEERMNRGLILGPDGQKMSKSKGNVIDPDEWVEKVGADTVRMYLAFIGPYNEVGQYPWDLGGIAGTRRFLEKIWRISLELKARSLEVGKDKEKLQVPSSKLSASLHKTIKKVTEDIENYKFNTAISALMVFINKCESEITEENLTIFLKLLAPFAPHMAEELWSQLGHKDSIHLEKWPKYDESKIKDEQVIIVVQVNGKVRAQFEAETGVSESDAKEKALALPEIQKWLSGSAPKKIIFVPNKIINLVA